MCVYKKNTNHRTTAFKAVCANFYILKYYLLRAPCRQSQRDNICIRRKKRYRAPTKPATRNPDEAANR